MSWLFEGRLPVILVLGAILIILLVAWWQIRTRHLLIALAGVAALLGIYLLLNFLVETDAEADRREVQTRIQAMADAIRQRNINQLGENISEDFRSTKGATKQQLLDTARRFIQSGQVTEVTLWEYEFEEGFSREKGSGKVLFRFKFRGSLGTADELFYRCECTFRHYPGRGWLLTGVRILYPDRDEEIPLPI